MGALIRFGTSGWRAVIAEEFTVANVRRVASAIATRVLADGAAGRGVFIGFDTRFLSDRFAREAAEVLAASGIAVALSPAPVPTPAIALAVVGGRRAGGLNITASHNPPEYNGLKFSTADGAPARPEVTREIEARANSDDAGPGGRAQATARIRELDMRPAYFRQIGRLVRLDVVRRGRLTLGLDPRHGASIAYLGGLARTAARTVAAIHDTADPRFGGTGPDCGEEQLRPGIGALKFAPGEQSPQSGHQGRCFRDRRGTPNSRQ